MVINCQWSRIPIQSSSKLFRDFNSKIILAQISDDEVLEDWNFLPDEEFEKHLKNLEKHLILPKIGEPEDWAGVGLGRSGKFCP